MPEPWKATAGRAEREDYRCGGCSSAFIGVYQESREEGTRSKRPVFEGEFTAFDKVGEGAACVDPEVAVGSVDCGLQPRGCGLWM